MKYPLTHREYFDGLKLGLVLGLRCKRCGCITAPPKMTCLSCSSPDLEVVQLSGIGTVRTYTVIRVAPEGYDAPYGVAMVELDEGPWLMGFMDYAYIERLGETVIGTKVKLGHKMIAADLYSAGEGVIVSFTPVSDNRQNDDNVGKGGNRVAG